MMECNLPNLPDAQHYHSLELETADRLGVNPDLRRKPATDGRWETFRHHVHLFRGNK